MDKYKWSFIKVKDRLALAPILNIPKVGETSVVFMDALKENYIVVLMQDSEVIIYTYRRLQ